MKAQSIGKMAAWCGLCLMQTALADGSAGTDSASAQEPVEAEKGRGPCYTVVIDFCTRQLTYGLADNREPIMTAEAAVEWYGFTFKTALIFDTTKWGRKQGGYGNRQGKYQELAFGPGYTCSFSPERFAFLPTAVELSANTLYEYHPPVRRARGESNPDTQFINVGAALPDLWLTPALSAEFDIDNESGAIYLAGEIGHSFTLIEAAGGRETDPLALSLGAGVGFGNPRRNTYDAEFDAYAFKDVWVSAALEWHIADHVTLTPYVAAYEQLHRRLREAARASIDDETHSSAQLIGGVRLAACF
jgi:hypothetical protein